MKRVVPLPAKRMLTDEEAADYCGFKTVRQFVAQATHRVPAVNFGNYHRWDRNRLDEWLDMLTASPAMDVTGFGEALLRGNPPAGKKRLHGPSQEQIDHTQKFLKTPLRKLEIKALIGMLEIDATPEGYGRPDGAGPSTSSRCDTRVTFAPALALGPIS